MFKKLSLEEQLQQEKERNLMLLNKQVDLENAVFELAEVIAMQSIEEVPING